MTLFHKYAYIQFQHARNSVQQKILGDKSSISGKPARLRKEEAIFCTMQFYFDGRSEFWMWIKHLKDSNCRTSEVGFLSFSVYNQHINNVVSIGGVWLVYLDLMYSECKCLFINRTKYTIHLISPFNRQEDSFSIKWNNTQCNARNAPVTTYKEG